MNEVCGSIQNPDVPIETVKSRVKQIKKLLYRLVLIFLSIFFIVLFDEFFSWGCTSSRIGFKNYYLLSWICTCSYILMFPIYIIAILIERRNGNYEEIDEDSDDDEEKVEEKNVDYDNVKRIFLFSIVASIMENVTTYTSIYSLSKLPPSIQLTVTNSHGAILFLISFLLLIPDVFRFLDIEPGLPKMSIWLLLFIIICTLTNTCYVLFVNLLFKDSESPIYPALSCFIGEVFVALVYDLLDKKIHISFYLILGIILLILSTICITLEDLIPKRYDYLTNIVFRICIDSVDNETKEESENSLKRN